MQALLIADHVNGRSQAAILKLKHDGYDGALNMLAVKTVSKDSAFYCLT